MGSGPTLPAKPLSASRENGKKQHLGEKKKYDLGVESAKANGNHFNER